MNLYLRRGRARDPLEYAGGGRQLVPWTGQPRRDEATGATPGFPGGVAYQTASLNYEVDSARRGFRYARMDVTSFIRYKYLVTDCEDQLSSSSEV